MRAAIAVMSGFLALASPVFADTLASILGRMDREAATFHQMTANLIRTDYTAVLQDTSVESGTVYMRRSGRKMEMRTEITKPEPKSAAFHDDTGEVYYPKINTVQIYNLGGNQALIDQVLLLGFGTTGKLLLSNYELKVGGEETIDGRSTTRLDMAPKSQKVLANFKLIQMWIPDNVGYPVRLRMVEPSGNYYQFTYSDVKLNPNLPASIFRLQLPANVKKEYPQK